MQTIEYVPVVIIGAGPAGLTAALCLARQGIQVRVLERHPGTSLHPRARGLNVRTMEIYRNVGLESAIRQAAAALAGSKNMLFVETLAGNEIRRIPDDDLVTTGDALAAYTPCTWVQCAQDELEPLLLETARRLGADVRFGMGCVSLTQDDHHVLIECRDVTTGNVHSVQAQYLIAADGVKGESRETIGIPLIERAVQGYYVNIYFRADLRNLIQGREFALCFVETPSAPGIILAINNADRWLFNAEYDPTTTSPDTFTLDRCIEVVRAAVGIPNLSVEVLSVLPWAATARYVIRMQAGRVFLMGDSAHTMPPAGGFGLNTGVADAHNLAWKLAFVLQGQATSTLLESYDEERLPVAKQVVEHAVAELTAERPDMPAGEGLKPVLGFSYSSTAVLSNGTPLGGRLDLTGRPGTRVPHVWLERQGERISTLDLVDTSIVLLVGPKGDAWKSVIQKVSTQFHIPIPLYQIGGEEIRDLSNTWCTANGVGQTGAMLVRPDGIVLWRIEQMPEDAPEVLTQVFTYVLRK